MSRYIEVDEVYRVVKETIKSMDECRHSCNDVCCNEASPCLGSLIFGSDCAACTLFEKEDGIITDQ